MKGIAAFALAIVLGVNSLTASIGKGGMIGGGGGASRSNSSSAASFGLVCL